MFKKLLLFVILFQSVNAALETTKTIPEKKDNSPKFEKCRKEDGHVLLSKDRVCIPGEVKWKIQHPPWIKKYLIQTLMSLKWLLL